MHRWSLLALNTRTGDPGRVARGPQGEQPALARRCDVYRAPNGARGGYTQHLKRVLPMLVEGMRYEWVLVLLMENLLR